MSSSSSHLRRGCPQGGDGRGRGRDRDLKPSKFRGKRRDASRSGLGRSCEPEGWWGKRPAAATEPRPAPSGAPFRRSGGPEGAPGWIHASGRPIEGHPGRSARPRPRSKSDLLEAELLQLSLMEVGVTVSHFGCLWEAGSSTDRLPPSFTLLVAQQPARTRSKSDLWEAELDRLCSGPSATQSCAPGGGRRQHHAGAGGEGRGRPGGHPRRAAGRGGGAGGGRPPGRRRVRRPHRAGACGGGGPPPSGGLWRPPPCRDGPARAWTPPASAGSPAALPDSPSPPRAPHPAGG